MAVTAVLLVLLLASDASAQLPPKWIALYEGTSRACDGSRLIMKASTVSLDDCRSVKYRVVTVSETQLIFEVDPKAKCGWAEWLIALTEIPPGNVGFEVTAYRSREKQQAKEYSSYCVYMKRVPDD